MHNADVRACVCVQFLVTALSRAGGDGLKLAGSVVAATQPVWRRGLIVATDSLDERVPDGPCADTLHASGEVGYTALATT